MKQVSKVYGFRIISAILLLTVAMIPIWIKPDVTLALVLYPILLITLMSVLALIEQHLLMKEQRINETRELLPVKVHKLQLKKVRSYRHSGCRLLGLSCAA